MLEDGGNEEEELLFTSLSSSTLALFVCKAPVRLFAMASVINNQLILRPMNFHIRSYLRLSVLPNRRRRGLSVCLSLYQSAICLLSVCCLSAGLNVTITDPCTSRH